MSVRKYLYKGRHRSSAPSHTGRIAAASAVAVAIGLAGAPTAQAAEGDTWDRLAECESGGNWKINTGNGYYGGLQFNPRTWSSHGGQGSAHTATRAQQIAVAERVLASQGWGAWPACSKKLGLRGTPAPQKADAPQKKTEKKAEQKRPAEKKSAPPKSETPARGDGNYTVQSGDTLTEIGAEHGKHWREIFVLNQHVIADHDLIFPGQNIKV